MTQATRSSRPRRIRAADGAARTSMMRIWGRHTVEAALLNPARELRKLYITDNAAARIADALGHARARGLEIEPATPATIGKRCDPHAVHQGVVLEASPLPEPGLDTVLDGAALIVVLDQITDPHNVGAILRSSAGFGANAVIATTRHVPGITGTLAKAASGALEHIALVRVKNLARALDAIGRNGLTRIGLDGLAETRLGDVDMPERLALVVGAEGAGLRRLTRTHCDYMARLDLPGPIKTLNVSNATAVALSMMSRRSKTPV